MTIADVPRLSNDIGDGVNKTFNIPFKFFDTADLKFTITDPDTGGITNPTPDTIMGVGLDNGGSYTLLDAPTTGYIVTVEANADMSQEDSIGTSNEVYPPAFELALDKVVALVQQLKGLFGRSLTAPSSDGSIDEIPIKTLRANTTLAFDADGQPIAGPSATAIADAQTNATAAQAAATTALAAQAAAEAAAANAQTWNPENYSPIDQTARNIAIAAFIKAEITSNDPVGVYGTVISDDFSSDTLAVQTNATYDAAGDYYTNSATGSYTQEQVFTGSGSPGAQSLLAQSFQVSTTDPITKFKWTSQGSAATLDWTIETDNSGAPSGILVDANAHADAVVAPTVYAEEQVVNLVGSWVPATATTYWLVCRQTGGGNVPANVWNYSKSPSYANGTAYWAGSAQAYDWVFGIHQQSLLTNMTLQPSGTALTVADPIDVSSYFLIEDIDTVTDGTDRIISLSIDGGTTWAVSTISDIGSYGSTDKLILATADVSAQSGSSFVWKLETFNNKSQRIKAAASVPGY